MLCLSSRLSFAFIAAIVHSVLIHLSSCYKNCTSLSWGIGRGSHLRAKLCVLYNYDDLESRLSLSPPPRSKPGKTSSLLRRDRGLHLPNDSSTPLHLRTLPDRCSFRSPRRDGRSSLLLLATDAEAARLALSLRAGEGAVQPWRRSALAVGALPWAISVELAMRKGMMRGRRVKRCSFSPDPAPRTAYSLL
jgi:hypothetical protein